MDKLLETVDLRKAVYIAACKCGEWRIEKPIDSMQRLSELMGQADAAHVEHRKTCRLATGDDEP